MQYVVWGVLYVCVGHLAHATSRRLQGLSPVRDASLGALVLWWVAWPLAVTGLVGEAIREGLAGLAKRSPKRTARPLADPAHIAELERELGIPPLPDDPSSSDDVPRSPAPKRHRLPWLPGTSASACQLPTFSKEGDFEIAYGWTTRVNESQANRDELNRTLRELQRITDDFEGYAEVHTGQEALEASLIALRRITRVEGALTPLFAGLTFARYGRARKACVDARARVGNILDAQALAGRL